MEGRAAAPSRFKKERCDVSLTLLLLFFSIPVHPLNVGDLGKMKEAKGFRRSDYISLVMI